MKVNDLEELNERAEKLEAAARELPEGWERDEILRDIEQFRAKLAEFGFKSSSVK
jgi:hypothetical protein